MEIIQLRDIGRLKNYIYILYDKASNWCGVVDPTEADPVLELLNEKGWELKSILSTHHHPDHIGGNLKLKNITNCEIIGSLKGQNRIPGITRTVDAGDILKFGAIEFEVLFTPGHTKDHISFYCRQESALFCGDTLFILGCGRIFDGTAQDLWQSLKKFRALPTDTMIYCAHDYSAANADFALHLDPDNQKLKEKAKKIYKLRQNGQPTVPSQIGEEIETNPFMRSDDAEMAKILNMEGEKSERIFAEMRRRKDHF